VAEPAPNEAEGPRRERQKAKRQNFGAGKFCLFAEWSTSKSFIQ
jgi:hypothetical protein